MNGFNKDNLKTLCAEIDAALNAVAQKHGLNKLAIGNVSFTETTFRSTLQAECDAADGVTAAQVRWNELCAWIGQPYGLKPEHFGSTFTDHKGLIHTVKDVKKATRGSVVNVITTMGGQDFQWKVSAIAGYIQKADASKDS